MRIRMPWGTEIWEAEIADARVIYPRAAEPTPTGVDIDSALAEALDHPLDYPPLYRALTPDDHLAIIVDEGVPQLPRLIEGILRHVAKGNVRPEAVTLVCLPPSTGQTWLDELADEFQEVQVEVHHPEDRKKLAYLATSKGGRRLYLNRTLVDADQSIVLTRRCYDPLLGHAGGEMALYPGLSDETTRQELATRLAKEAPSDQLWPIEQEAREAAWLMGAPFLVQVIPGAGDSIADIVAGPVESSDAGKKKLDERWHIQVPEPADVVIASVVGADPSAEELAKAFFAAARVVKPAGQVVVLSAAQPEWGPSFEVLRKFDEAYPALKILLKDKPSDLSVGFMWASAAMQARLYLLSEAGPDFVEEIHATPLENIGQLQRWVNGTESITFLAEANKMLAEVRKSELERQRE